MQTMNTKEANLSGRPRTRPALRLELAIGAEAGHLAQVLLPRGLLVKVAGVTPLATTDQPLPAVLIPSLKLEHVNLSTWYSHG